MPSVLCPSDGNKCCGTPRWRDSGSPPSPRNSASVRALRASSRYVLGKVSERRGCRHTCAHRRTISSARRSSSAWVPTRAATHPGAMPDELRNTSSAAPHAKARPKRRTTRTTASQTSRRCSRGQTQAHEQANAKWRAHRPPAEAAPPPPGHPASRASASRRSPTNRPASHPHLCSRLQRNPNHDSTHCQLHRCPTSRGLRRRPRHCQTQPHASGLGRHRVRSDRPRSRDRDRHHLRKARTPQLAPPAQSARQQQLLVRAGYGPAARLQGDSHRTSSDPTRGGTMTTAASTSTPTTTQPSPPSHTPQPPPPRRGKNTPPQTPPPPLPPPPPPPPPRGGGTGVLVSVSN